MTLKNSDTNATGSWKGYTLEELNFRRALNAVQIDIEKERLMRNATTALPILGRGNRHPGEQSILSKLLGALSYVDYAILGFRLFKSLRSLRRRK